MTELDILKEALENVTRERDEYYSAFEELDQRYLDCHMENFELKQLLLAMPMDKHYRPDVDCNCEKCEWHLKRTKLLHI